jgi:hypothetical protein
MGKINRLAILFLPLLLLAGLLFSRGVSAACNQDQQACSTDYGVGEYFFGSGGAVDNSGTGAYCSTNYCAAQTLGEIGQGLSGSTDYQTYAGFEVNREPSLQFIINTTSVNLGTLTTSTTATGTASFSVESYLANGYVVETVSPPPQFESHTLAAPSTPTSSLPGTEQFGINLVANTSPVAFGSNPTTTPSSAFSNCTATYHYCIASGYYTQNKYQYINGSNIVNSADSSGQVNFTISYIANISSVTPAGVYNMNQDLVALPTF